MFGNKITAFITTPKVPKFIIIAYQLNKINENCFTICLAKKLDTFLIVVIFKLYNNSLIEEA